jgi:hypothetical protein
MDAMMSKLAQRTLSVGLGGSAILAYGVTGAGVGVTLQGLGFEFGLGIGLALGSFQLVIVLIRGLLKLCREESQHQATYHLKQLHHAAALEQQREGRRTALDLFDAMRSMGVLLPITIDSTGKISISMAAALDSASQLGQEQAIDSAAGMPYMGPPADEAHPLSPPVPSEGQNGLPSALPVHLSTAAEHPNGLTSGNSDVQA